MTPHELLLIAEAREAARTGRGRELRQALDLSQSDIARTIRVEPQTISRWEGQRRSPRGAAAVRYARLLRLLAERQERAP